MVVEVGGGEPHTQLAAGFGAGGRWWRRTGRGDHAGDHLAVGRLQLAVVSGLIREDERLGFTDHASRLREAGLGRALQLRRQVLQVVGVGLTTRRDFRLSTVDDGQASHSQGQARA